MPVSSGKANELYSHLSKRPDGKQVLFIYDKAGSPVVNVILRTGGKTAYKYELNGTPLRYELFDGRALSNVRLTPGDVAIFRIDP